MPQTPPSSSSSSSSARKRKAVDSSNNDAVGTGGSRDNCSDSTEKNSPYVQADENYDDFNLHGAYFDEENTEGARNGNDVRSSQQCISSSSSTDSVLTAEDLVLAKGMMWGSLTRPLDSEYLKKEEHQIRKCLNSAFVEHVSSSIIIIGPPGGSKKQLLDRIVGSFVNNDSKNANTKEVSIARVNGFLCQQDNVAIKLLADQFLVRSATENRHFNLAVEDLETHFRQCKINKTPAIIVLEEIDLFAVRDKQILIYTLLDLMHKRDLLFVVVGLTASAHIHQLLEKRILSRLNAQFVYIPVSSEEEVRTILINRLTSPLLALVNGSDGSSNNSGSISSAFKAFILKFVLLICELLGQTKRLQIKPTGSKGEELHIVRFSREGTGDSSGAAVDGDGRGEFTVLTKGSLSTVIGRYVDWGFDLDHFLNVAYTAVTELTLASPYITKSGFERSFQSLNNLSLLEVLSWLSNVELLLAISVYRLTVIKNMKFDINIGNIFDEFEKLFYFGAHSNPNPNPHSAASKELHEKDLYHALNVIVSLDLVVVSRYANRSDHPYKQMTRQHLVNLVPVPSEFKNAFRLDDDQAYDPTDLGGDTYVPVIKVAEKIRRAVLEPLERLPFN